MARQTLDQWIREALTDEEKDGKCTRLALIHIVNGQAEREIHTQKLAGKAWEPKDLAELFRKKAENFAGDLQGVQTFNLLAFYADRGEPQNRKPFIVQGETLEQGSLMTEGPTKEGLVGQCMRHNEAVMQLAFRSVASMVESTTRLIDRVAASNEKLMAENAEAFTLLKESAMQQITNTDERRMKYLEFQRGTEERKKWLSFGPALINNLLGREVFPQSTADSSLIDSLVDSLTEEDLMKLAGTGVIKPEIWGPLAQRMSKSLESRRLAQDEHRKIMNGADPEVEFQ